MDSRIRSAPRAPLRLAASLASLAFVAGCVSNSNGGAPSDDAGSFSPEDSGSSPGIDATIAADSSAPDAAPVQDTSTPDAPVDSGPAPVTLLVTNDLGPEPGVLVVFHDSTGAILGTATTGANGTVSQQLAPNSQVTAVLQNADGMGLVTIQGVQPGDALTAFDDVNLAIPGGTVNVNAVPDAGAIPLTDYSAYVGSCTGSSSAVPFSLAGDVAYPCEIQGQFPLLVTATTDSSELAYTYTTGNSFPLDGGPAQVSVTTPWATDESSPQLSVINVPPFGSSGGSLYLSFSEVAGNVGSRNVSFETPEDGGASALFVGHPGYAAGVQTEVALRNNIQNYYLASYQSLAARTGPLDGGSPSTVDFSQVLPQITGSTASVDDGGTTSRPIVSWTAASSLGAADGLVVATSFTIDYDGGSFGSVWWTIIAPPTATSVVPPELPASLGTPAVNTGGRYGFPTVVAVEASYFTGYAQLRQASAAMQPTPALLNDNGAPVAPTLPADGTLNLSAVTSNGD
jgi:hypothetical protein